MVGHTYFGFYIYTIPFAISHDCSRQKSPPTPHFSRTIRPPGQNFWSCPTNLLDENMINGYNAAAAAAAAINAAPSPFKSAAAAAAAVSLGYSHPARQAAPPADVEHRGHHQQQQQHPSSTATAPSPHPAAGGFDFL